MTKFLQPFHIHSISIKPDKEVILLLDWCWSLQEKMRNHLTYSKWHLSVLATIINIRVEITQNCKSLSLFKFQYSFWHCRDFSRLNTNSNNSYHTSLIFLLLHLILIMSIVSFVLLFEQSASVVSSPVPVSLLRSPTEKGCFPAKRKSITENKKR